MFKIAFQNLKCLKFSTGRFSQLLAFFFILINHYFAFKKKITKSKNKNFTTLSQDGMFFHLRKLCYFFFICTFAGFVNL